MPTAVVYGDRPLWYTAFGVGCVAHALWFTGIGRFGTLSASRSAAAGPLWFTGIGRFGTLSDRRNVTVDGLWFTGIGRFGTLAAELLKALIELWFTGIGRFGTLAAFGANPAMGCGLRGSAALVHYYDMD